MSAVLTTSSGLALLPLPPGASIPVPDVLLHVLVVTVRLVAAAQAHHAAHVRTIHHVRRTDANVITTVATVTLATLATFAIALAAQLKTVTATPRTLVIARKIVSPSQRTVQTAKTSRVSRKKVYTRLLLF